MMKGMIESEEEAVVYVSMFLRGAADTWLQGLQQQYRAIPPHREMRYSEFRLALRERFQGAADEKVARAEFRELRMKPGEKVISYFNRYQQIAHRIPTMDMTTKMETFVSNLPLSIRQPLAMMGATDAATAASWAQQIEGTLMDAAGSSSSSSSSSGWGSAGGNRGGRGGRGGQSVHNIEGGGGGGGDSGGDGGSSGGGGGGGETSSLAAVMVSPLPNSPPRQFVGPSACYRCGEDGHFRQSCHYPGDKSKDLCHYCKSPEHYKWSCKSRRVDWKKGKEELEKRQGGGGEGGAAVKPKK